MSARTTRSCASCVPMASSRARQPEVARAKSTTRTRTSASTCRAASTCYRCERICAHLQGQFTWRVWNRGAETRFVPDSGTTLRASSCVSCGACADTLPFGCAARQDARWPRGAPLRWTRTTCPYCGVGCEMQVGARDGRIVQVRPALDAPVNKGHLCVKGRYAFGFVDALDRVTAPMIRDGRRLAHGRWAEAIGARRRSACERSATRTVRTAIGVLGSARATNEENYLAQKFARVVIGTNNVDCCARVCHAPSAAALGRDARHRRRHQLVRRRRAGQDAARGRRKRDREPPDRRRTHATGRARAARS